MILESVDIGPPVCSFDVFEYFTKSSGGFLIDPADKLRWRENTFKMWVIYFELIEFTDF